MIGYASRAVRKFRPVVEKNLDLFSAKELSFILMALCYKSPPLDWLKMLIGAILKKKKEDVTPSLICSIMYSISKVSVAEAFMHMYTSPCMSGVFVDNSLLWLSSTACAYLTDRNTCLLLLEHAFANCDSGHHCCLQCRAGFRTGGVNQVQANTMIAILYRR